MSITLTVTGNGKGAFGIVDCLAGVLIIVFAAQVYFESRIKSPTSDEPPHLASGLSYVETGIFRGNLQHPPLLKELSGLFLKLAGIHFPRTPETEKFLRGDIPLSDQPEWGIGNKIISDNGPDRVMFWARLPMLFVACLLAVTLFLLARQMLGALAALGALLLCTLDPIILGHADYLTMDVGFAAFTVLFLLAIWNYVRYPSALRLVLCGLALGAVLGAKFSAVLLLPVAAALLFAAVVWPAEAIPDRKRTTLDPYFPGLAELDVKSGGDVPGKPRALGISGTSGRNEKCPCGSGKKYKACHGADAARTSTLGSSPELFKRFSLCAVALLAMCAVAFVVIQSLYFFPRDPLTYYRGLMMVNGDHLADYKPYLAGELQSRFLSYFALAYLLKEPIASIILTAIGLVFLFGARKIPVFCKIFIILPPVVLFIAHTVLADNIGVRYIIPALPFAHLIGGLGLATLWQSTAKWGRYAAVGLGAWLVLATAGIYPDHLSYFNESACLFAQPSRIGIDGGTACGPLWLDDSNVDWGQGLKQLKVWLDRNAPGRQVRVINVFGFPPETYKIPAKPLNGTELNYPPPPGLYAVSAHMVARMPAINGQTEWLRTTQPVAIVGHAFYIYDVAGSVAGTR